MTINEIQEKIDQITKESGDDETAHALEDALHQDVLRAIASGDDYPSELARKALTTLELEFARWCA